MNNRNHGIISWFIANPVAANLLMVIVIILGIMQAASLQKESFPSMEPDSLSISVSYDSGSARQAEEGIAMKIEDLLEEISGIDTITSSSSGSGASLNVKMVEDYDLDTLLEDVKSKIDSISSFPTDAKNPVISKAQREEHSLWLQLYGSADRATLQKLADNLKNDLLAQDFVSRVSVSGLLDPMILIQIDEERLQAYTLTLTDVEQAINEGSSNTMSAVLKNEDVYLQLQSSQQAYYKKEFSSIPLLTTDDGRQLLLGEVAIISDTFDDDTAVLSRFNGADSIGLQIVATDQDDISDSVTGALEVVEEWQSGSKLPEGIELATWYDRSKMIEDRLDLLVKNGITGIGLVFLLLAVFLNLTVAFWVAMGLPFIFFGTLYCMGISFIDLTLNEFTTFGFIMALGIVVDDAVVVGESVYTFRRRQGDNQTSTVKGTMEVALPTLFGVFTTVAAFYALSQTAGRLGQLYSQFAIVVAICLVLSVIESKLILPAHLNHVNTTRRKSSNPYILLWQKIQDSADTLLQLFSDKVYRKIINLALRHRYTVTILFLALFILVISMPFTGKVRLSFFPDIVGDTVRAELVMQKDATFGQTHSALNRLEELADQTDRELRGVSQVSAIGNLQLLSESDQSGKITVELTADSPYDIKQFTRRWQELAGLPEGVRSLSIQNAPRMVSALRVELRSNDEQELTAAGQKLQVMLEDIQAVSGIEDNLEPGLPQLNLELNQQGRALGLTTDMLSQQILQAFSGQVVQQFQRGSDEIEVKVRYPEENRSNAADVLQANIRTEDGTVLPLSSVATISYGYTRDSINRIDGKRAVYISADVDKDQLSATELVAKLKRELVPELERAYPGLDIHFAGEAKEQAETQNSMIKMFLLALLMIYILLAIPLQSYIQPILIMLAIPFGVVGAVLGHWWNDLSLGILSLNGIIALSGVVVNDSLLVVARFNRLRKQGGENRELISRACRDRLRAVLLTSVTTFAGLMPLLGETSMQAQFLIPAAVSLAYGIMFATVITLVLIPSMLMIQLDIAKVFSWVKNKITPSTVEEQPLC